MFKITVYIGSSCSKAEIACIVLWGKAYRIGYTLTLINDRCIQHWEVLTQGPKQGSLRGGLRAEVKHTHTHTHTHTRKHPHPLTYTHAHTRTHTLANTPPPHIHTRTHPQKHAHAHTETNREVQSMVWVVALKDRFSQFNYSEIRYRDENVGVNKAYIYIYNKSTTTTVVFIVLYK